MKSMKKTLSCLLALTMAAGMFAVPVTADETEEQAAVIEAANEAAAPDAPVYDTDGTPDENGFIVENGVLTGYEGTGGDIVIPDGVTNISANVFADNTKVRTLTMPDSVTDMYLFFDSIDNIDSVNTIGRSPFHGCTNLMSVNLSKNLKYLTGGTFKDCTSLKSIEIPDSVTIIGACAFQNSGLETIKWGGKVQKIGWSAFENTLFKSIEIPDSVTFIGNACFANCQALESVAISNSVEDGNFGERVFSACTALKSIQFGKKMTKITKLCFDGCTALTDLVLPDNIKYLDEWCFKGCTSLKNVDFGVIETYIDAFRACSSIEELMLPNTITRLENVNGNIWPCFNGMTGVKRFRIPSSYKDISSDDLYWGLDTVFPNLKELYLDVNTVCFKNNDFKGSTKLVDIYYTGTMEDWNKKVVYCNPDIFLVNNMDNYIIHCSDGKIVGKNVPPEFDPAKTVATAKYNGRNYALYDYGCDWEDAKDLCAELGGYLATITSAEEQAVINKMLEKGSKNSYWIGGTRNSSGDFEWITGEEFSYTNWAPYMPDNYGVENALMVYKNSNYYSSLGEWNDLNPNGTCDEQEFFGIKNFGFIVEYGTVVKKNVKSIKVTPPTKKEYTIGETLDITGGSITVTYSDGKGEENIPLTLDMCSGFDSSKAGTKTVTVTYEGKKATFTVTVMNKPIATLDDTPIESISAALKGLKSGEHTIFITSSYTEKTITIPKDLEKVTIICDGGVTLTTNTITANSPLVLDDVTLSGVNPAKPTVIKANSDFSANSGTFGNVTVKGKAELSDITVNGNLALKAKADKSGLTTDTLERITVTKKVSSNNNVEFVDCPSIGTVNVKGLVKISGEETTKAVSVTSGAKTGTSTIENLEVEKKLSVSADLSAYNLTANNAVSVKGNAVIEQSTIAGKLAVTKNLTAEGIGVKSAVDVKGNAVIDFSTILGKLNVKGILTVNSDVRVENAVTCAELNSTEGAELTALSLSVTKNGVSADSAEITLTLIDKFGGEFTPQPDKKGVITVSKKFKDSKTKEKEFDVPALKFNNSGTICPLKCVSGKLVVSS